MKEAQQAGLSAERQPLSGVLERFPNDAFIEFALVECKVRTAELSFDGRKFFSFDLSWLKNVVANAAKNNFRMGVVVFASKHSQDKYVALRYEDFISLVQDSKLYRDIRLSSIQDSTKHLTANEE